MNSLPRVVVVAFAHVTLTSFMEQEKASPSAPRPAARAGHALVYDTKREAVVLVNGDHVGADAKKGELWQWDGKQWSNVEEKGPAPRTLSGVAYDTKHKQLVLQGGIGPGDALHGDTWTFDGTKWRRHEDSKPTKGPTGPGVRNHHAMAFDAARGVAVLFGGQDAAMHLLGDTWTWDGERWKQAATSGPSPRVHHALVDDAARERVLLYGGTDGARDLDDFWEWDGKAWRRLETKGKASPGARTHHRMAFHVEQQVVYLVGGGDRELDVWTWDGAEWRATAGARPPARGLPGLAYDEARERLVLFGGYAAMSNLDDTWELVDETWVRAETTKGR